MKMILRSAVMALALAGAGPAHADAEVITGGVGEIAREELMRAYRDYNLHVAFAEQDGAFLADVGVTLRDAKGEVVWEGTAEGPMLFARVPSGRYILEARFEGKTKRRDVSAGNGPGKMHYVHWDLPGSARSALQGG